MRSLTIPQACTSTNIWFKVESEEQQRMFQEEFFRQGGSWFGGFRDQEVRTAADIIGFKVVNCTSKCFSKLTKLEQASGEQVAIFGQEEPSVTIDSLTPKVTLNPNAPYDDFIVRKEGRSGMTKCIGSVEVNLDFTTTGYSQAKTMLEVTKVLKAIQLELFEQIESESTVLASRFECMQEENLLDKTNP